MLIPTNDEWMSIRGTQSGRTQSNIIIEHQLILKAPFHTYLTISTHRTQHLVEETLQRFVKDSNVTILHYSGRPSKETTQTSANPLSTASSNGSLSDGNASSEKSSIVGPTESENLLKRREATLLNSALRVELNREASFYLSTMDGIIEGGKHFIPGKLHSTLHINQTSRTNCPFLLLLAQRYGSETKRTLTGVSNPK